MTIQDLFDEYQKRFQPDRAEGVDGIIQLHLTGDDGGDYYLTVKDKQLHIDEGTHDDPTTRVTASAQDWIDLSRGKANPMALMMKQRLKVKGSIPMATKFQSLFRM